MPNNRLKILGLPADVWADGSVGGCGSYRIVKPLEAIQRADLAETEWRVIQGKTPEVRAEEIHQEGFTHVVLQRQTAPIMFLFMVALQRQGIKVVYDFDDQLLDIPPESPSYAFFGAKKKLVWKAFLKLKDRGRVDPNLEGRWDSDKALMAAQQRRMGLLRMVQNADLVTVTTPYLAKIYERHTDRPIVVLENQIDPRDWEGLEKFRPQPDDPVYIGWAGSDSHEPDLKAVADQLARVLFAHRDIRLLLVGYPEAKAFFRAKKQIETVPWSGLEAYREHVAGFSVGLAPSVDCALNRGKSVIKIMEYALANGMPVVAMKTPYADAIHDGMGLVAKNPKQFGKMVNWVLDNLGEAKEMGKRLKEHVLAEHTYDAHAGEWAEAYREVM